MHETAIAASVLRVALDALQNHEATSNLRISKITVQAGLLSAIEPQTLSGCFEIMAEETLAKGATLMVETLALGGRCQECQKDIAVTARRFCCPLCGSTTVDWENGQGLSISSIEVEQDL